MNFLFSKERRLIYFAGHNPEFLAAVPDVPLEKQKEPINTFMNRLRNGLQHSEDQIKALKPEIDTLKEGRFSRKKFLSKDVARTEKEIERLWGYLEDMIKMPERAQGFRSTVESDYQSLRQDISRLSKDIETEKFLDQPVTLPEVEASVQKVIKALSTIQWNKGALPPGFLKNMDEMDTLGERAERSAIFLPFNLQQDIEHIRTYGYALTAFKVATTAESTPADIENALTQSIAAKYNRGSAFNMMAWSTALLAKSKYEKGEDQESTLRIAEEAIGRALQLNDLKPDQLETAKQIAEHIKERKRFIIEAQSEKPQ